MRSTLGNVTWLIGMVLVAVLIGCSDQNEVGSARGSQHPIGGSELTGKLQLTGSSTVGPLVLEIAKRFEMQHPGVRVDVQTGGSSRGMSDTRRGLADIGMVSRGLRDGESDLLGHTIALDGIAVIVHEDNPIDGLTDRQIIDVYTGKIVNWNQVGGDDAPIVVVHKAEGRSTQELFLHYFDIDPRAVRASIIIGDNQQGMKTISADRRGIGYVSIGAGEHAVASGVPLRLLPLNDIEPTTANVLNGTYPLRRSLNLVTSGTPAGLAGSFIEFARSGQVTDIVRDLCFVPAEG